MAEEMKKSWNTKITGLPPEDKSCETTLTDWANVLRANGEWMKMLDELYSNRDKV